MKLPGVESPWTSVVSAEVWQIGMTAGLLSWPLEHGDERARCIFGLVPQP